MTGDRLVVTGLSARELATLAHSAGILLYELRAVQNGIETLVAEAAGIGCAPTDDPESRHR